jgi:hypothetical protein
MVFIVKRSFIYKGIKMEDTKKYNFLKLSL